MSERILVPLDGSSAAETVLSYAAHIAKSLQHSMTLLHVIDLRDWTTGIRSVPHSYIEQIWEESAASARVYLEKQAKALKAEGIDATISIREGDPGEIIATFGEQGRPWLIAMSTHARAGIEHMLLGSVAERVLYHAQSPLLLVHPTSVARSMTPLQGVITPLDGSSEAEAALPMAIKLAQGLGVPVTLLRVVPLASALFGTPDYPVNMVEELQTTAAEYLELSCTTTPATPSWTMPSKRRSS